MVNNMYNNDRILALIPARGGSKGIKDKNIISLNGDPLISYTILSSLKSKYIDDTVVTTDSQEIANISKKYGASVPFMRPAELASDQARTIDAVLHAIKSLDEMGNHYDILVLLQPTQPLRTTVDIDRAIEKFFAKGMKGLVSISPVNEHPLLMRTMDEDGNVESLLGENSTCRRQDMKSYYKVNGCIYINRISEISQNTSFNDNLVGYVMSVAHSVDIDDMKDLYLAEYYIQKENMENIQSLM